MFMRKDVWKILLTAKWVFLASIREKEPKLTLFQPSTTSPSYKRATLASCEQQFFCALAYRKIEKPHQTITDKLTS